MGSAVVISASRRCDIPRFRFEWFMERLDAGFVDVANPFNAAQVRRVSLLPPPLGETDALVFWTRDPGPVLARAEELERRGFRFFVMVTVTGYPQALEPNVPPLEVVCAAMRELAGKIGDRRVIWRYDPVFFCSLTAEDFHRRNFSELAGRLAGSTRRVIISLYDGYRNAKKRIEALEKSGALRLLPDLDPGPLFADLAGTARGAGMEIQSCAEAENFAAFGIRPGACIDEALLRELWGIETGGRDKHQRPHCLCGRSVDIGRYGDCPAGCAYCYAR
jgi:hypothetical protein